MLVDIIYVRPRKNFFLYLKFEDGLTGVIHLETMLSFEGIFSPLKEWVYFCLVKVNPDLGTIVWPNGADIDPIVLYEEISNRKRKKNRFYARPEHNTLQ